MAVDRRIIFAAVIFILTLLLIRSEMEIGKSRQGIRGTGQEGDLAQYDRIPLEPPSHIPYYSRYDQIGGLEHVVADYTPVPHTQGKGGKAVENPKNYVIDRKFTYFGKDGQVAPADAPEVLSDIDIGLAATMAGKTKQEVTPLWENLTPEEIGRMLNKTRSTSAKIRQELIDSNITDKNIDLRYKEENEFIKSLKLDFSCGDTRSDCTMWKENNDCIINPDFMFKNCPGSCGTCKMTGEQKMRLVKIYNERTPINCVHHDGYKIKSSNQMYD